MKIVMIGSGNLATQLSLALKDAGQEIVQIFGRTEAHAQELADKIGCAYTTSVDAILRDADIYILSVKDDALSMLVSAVCHSRQQGLQHADGSLQGSCFTVWCALSHADLFEDTSCQLP